MIHEPSTWCDHLIFPLTIYDAIVRIYAHVIQSVMTLELLLILIK